MSYWIYTAGVLHQALPSDYVGTVPRPEYVDQRPMWKDAVSIEPFLSQSVRMCIKAVRAMMLLVLPEDACSRDIIAVEQQVLQARFPLGMMNICMYRRVFCSVVTICTMYIVSSSKIERVLRSALE